MMIFNCKTNCENLEYQKKLINPKRLYKIQKNKKKSKSSFNPAIISLIYYGYII